MVAPQSSRAQRVSYAHTTGSHDIKVTQVGGLITITARRTGVMDDHDFLKALNQVVDG